MTDLKLLAERMVQAADEAFLEKTGDHNYVPAFIRRRAAAEAVARMLEAWKENNPGRLSLTELATLARARAPAAPDTRPLKVITGRGPYRRS